MDLILQIAGGVFLGGVMLGALFYGARKSVNIPADETPGSVILCLLFPVLGFGAILAANLL